MQSNIIPDVFVKVFSEQDQHLNGGSWWALSNQLKAVTECRLVAGSWEKDFGGQQDGFAG